MIQGTVGLLAAVPAALVHALDLFITSARSLMLLRAWDWNEGIYGGQRMTPLGTSLAMLTQISTRDVNQHRRVASLCVVFIWMV